MRHSCLIYTFVLHTEYTGPLCIKYQQIFLTPLFEYTKDPSAEVRQAATYGCGVLAQVCKIFITIFFQFDNISIEPLASQFGGDQFASHCAQFIARLVEVISAPGSRQPENINPTENAISSLTKILKYNSSAIPNLDELIAVWFSWLPVIEDQDEAPHVYGYFCDLIQANHPVILGPNNANLPKIVQIIAEAFATIVITGKQEQGIRMVNIVKQVEGSADVFAACLAVINEEQKQALEEAYREAAEAATAAIAPQA